MTLVDLVPGTIVEGVRWASPVEGGGTVVWLPVTRLDAQVASTEVTAGERKRAAGYSREGDRLLSLGSAWLARKLVAGVLDVAPLEVPIDRTCAKCARQHGRPVVASTAADGATVHISATHTRGLVGVALSTSGAVGLDVENLQARGPKAWRTVWRALGRPPVPEGPQGREAAGGLDRATRAAEVAASAWVRTEAVLKATGRGLAVRRGSVGIASAGKGGAPAVTSWPWGDPAGRVSLFDLRPGPPYVAALSVIHDQDGLRDF